MAGGREERLQCYRMKEMWTRKSSRMHSMLVICEMYAFTALSQKN